MRTAKSLNFVHILATCLVAALLTLAVPAADAQTGGADHEFTQQEIQSFARASLEVDRLNEVWIPRLQQAETQVEAEALRSEALSEIVEAIEAEGIELATYNAIIEEAQTNPDFAQEIDEYRRIAQ